MHRIIKKILSFELVLTLLISPVCTLRSKADPDGSNHQSNQNLIFTSERKLSQFVRVYNDMFKFFGEYSLVTEQDVFFKKDFLIVMGFLRFDSIDPTGLYSLGENDYLVELFWEIAEDNNI